MPLCVDWNVIQCGCESMSGVPILHLTQLQGTHSFWFEYHRACGQWDQHTTNSKDSNTLIFTLVAVRPMTTCTNHSACYTVVLWFMSGPHPGTVFPL